MAYKPKKQLGQNFLIDKSVIERIIVLGGITKEDIVLEIGPGQGSLTYALCKSSKNVIAVEKDEKLYDYLIKKFEKIKNVEFVNEDILEFTNSHEFHTNFTNGKYKIVGNIPYYLTSFLLRQIFTLSNRPSEVILMVQKEVAERMVAKPGEMNMLAISVQIFADVEILFEVSCNGFWPKPKVDSAVIKLKVKSEKLSINEESLFDIIHAGFGAKRKILVNNLAKGLHLPKQDICDIFNMLGLNLKSRAQDLSITEWVKIYNRLNNGKEK